MSAPLVYALHAVAHAWREPLWPEMIVLAEDLEAEVAEQRALGRRFVTAGELADDPRDAVVLTFDDGWADALTITAPLLSELGVRGTFFLCPGLFGNADPRMSPEGRVVTHEEAEVLHSLGMELGAHTMYHPDLAMVDEATAHREVAESKAAVEAITGRRCRTFAYPFGSHGPIARAAVRDAGFDLAFAFEPGPWHPLAVPRLPKWSARSPLPRCG